MLSCCSYEEQFLLFCCPSVIDALRPSWVIWIKSRKIKNRITKTIENKITRSSMKPSTFSFSSKLVRFLLGPNASVKIELFIVEKKSLHLLRRLPELRQTSHLRNLFMACSILAYWWLEDHHTGILPLCIFVILGGYQVYILLGKA